MEEEIRILSKRGRNRFSSTDAGVFVSLAAVILAVIGLGGVRTYWMAALVSIVLGTAQLLEMGGLISRLSAPGESAKGSRWDLGMEMTAGVLPGAAGIILGIVALLAVFPGTLLPVSAVLFGLGLVLSAWPTARLSDIYTAKTCRTEAARDVARAGVRIAQAFRAILGCGSVTLGLLALTVPYVVPVLLSLVAMLAIGCGVFMNSTFFSSTVMKTLRCAGSVPV